MTARPNLSSVDHDITGLRVPPHSDEAEQSVLGAMLLDNTAFDRATDLLKVGDFYRPDHRAVFEAISALITASKPADVITVFERLRSLDRADEAGGLPYLNELASSVASAANVRRHAEIVRGHSVLRQAIAACDLIATKAYDGADAQEVLDLANSTFGILERTGQRVEPHALGNLLVGALDRYSNLADGKDAPAIAMRWTRRCTTCRCSASSPSSATGSTGCPTRPPS